jgi:asparagine synthase (glutamine-hydrolysing)
MMPGLLQKATGGLLSLLPRVPVLRKGHRSMLQADFWSRYQSWHTVFSPDLKESLLRDSQNTVDAFADVFNGRVSGLDLDNLDKLMWLDIQAWLPDDLLMKKDRMGMATAIEARVPFLDHQFAEMAFSLSSRLKVKGLGGKYVLKKSMERLLPREIIYRKKAGFPTPISKWFQSDLRGPLTEMLCDSGPGHHDYFDQRVVRRLVEEHVSGRENHERLLFPILNFNLWYRTFFSGAAEPDYAALASS